MNNLSQPDPKLPYNPIRNLALVHRKAMKEAPPNPALTKGQQIQDRQWVKKVYPNG